jgi:hypothetical protein
LKLTDIRYNLLLACLRTMSQNQPTNERSQKFATEPVSLGQSGDPASACILAALVR